MSLGNGAPAPTLCHAMGSRRSPGELRSALLDFCPRGNAKDCSDIEPARLHLPRSHLRPVHPSFVL